jgi:hypothetical protein
MIISAKQNLQTAELECLRRVRGKTRRDKIRNQMIRTTLGTQPLQNTIEQAHLRWFRNFNRMDEERLTKQVWEARTEGLRNDPEEGHVEHGMTIYKNKTNKDKLSGLSPQANYSDRATAACRQS